MPARLRNTLFYRKETEFHSAKQMEHLASVKRNQKTRAMERDNIAPRRNGLQSNVHLSVRNAYKFVDVELTDKTQALIGKHIL